MCPFITTNIYGPTYTILLPQMLNKALNMDYSATDCRAWETL